MITYAIHCLLNPCGGLDGLYSHSRNRCGDHCWKRDKPSIGADINTMHRDVSIIRASHPHCRCQFEVIEL